VTLLADIIGLSLLFEGAKVRINVSLN